MHKEEFPASPVYVFSVGAFGGDVARYLKEFRSDAIEVEVKDDSALPSTPLPTARMNIVAAWRPVPLICEKLEEISYRWQRPFIPIILDSMVIGVGPVVVPTQGACWTCWTRRSAQYTAWPNERSALLQHYSLHPEAGPRGFLQSHAMMAAVRTAQTIEALDSSMRVGGYIWQMEILSRNITTATVVGIHNCPRCGMHRPAESRSFDELEYHLQYLWPKKQQRLGIRGPRRFIRKLFGQLQDRAEGFPPSRDCHKGRP